MREMKKVPGHATGSDKIRTATLPCWAGRGSDMRRGWGSQNLSQPSIPSLIACPWRRLQHTFSSFPELSQPPLHLGKTKSWSHPFLPSLCPAVPSPGRWRYCLVSDTLLSQWQFCQPECQRAWNVCCWVRMELELMRFT